MDASVFYSPDNDDADKNGAPRELEVSIKLTLLESAIVERHGEQALLVKYEVDLNVPSGSNPRFKLWLFGNAWPKDDVASRVLRDAPAMLLQDIGAALEATLQRRYNSTPSDNAGTEAAGAAKTEPHISDP